VSDRDDKGRFQSGQSGNPSGRPARASASVDASTYAHLADLGDAALSALEAAVKKGDRWAIEMVLQRVAPVPKSQPTTAEVYGPRAVKRLAATQRGREVAAAAVVIALEDRTLAASLVEAIREAMSGAGYGD